VGLVPKLKLIILAEHKKVNVFLRAAASGVPVWLVPQDRPTPGDILVRGSDRLS
jgi:hypothetical protein